MEGREGGRKGERERDRERHTERTGEEDVRQGIGKRGKGKGRVRE